MVREFHRFSGRFGVKSSHERSNRLYFDDGAMIAAWLAVSVPSVVCRWCETTGLVFGAGCLHVVLHWAAPAPGPLRRPWQRGSSYRSFHGCHVDCQLAGQLTFPALLAPSAVLQQVWKGLLPGWVLRLGCQFVAWLGTLQSTVYRKGVAKRTIAT